MSYKAGIIKAITELKDRTGSSSIAIKKHMQADMPKGKEWKNTVYLKALKKAVADGELTQNKGSYKLSAKTKAAKPKKKAAPKKKTAPKKKAAPKKKTAPKKKAVSNNVMSLCISFCYLYIIFVLAHMCHITHTVIE
jgi:histone H1/5